MLRKKGVVDKFVEFYGPGVKNLSLADRATISNMAPEYGATCGIFPIDKITFLILIKVYYTPNSTTMIDNHICLH
jgi:aconitate hydratase